ncbi:hypothetical protein BGZ97_010475, partial [Linnemannia gamsii]
MLGAEKMVCNKKPEVFYNAFMACDVNTPQLSAIFPGNYALSLDLDAKNNSIKAQLWMDNNEQFFCSIDACIVSTTELEGKIKTTWECPNLKCTCITTPTKLCGGIPTPAKIDLKNTIRDLTGPFTLNCPHDSTTCAFRIAALNGLLPNGLEMVNCKMGECVYPSEMSTSITSLQKTMPVGVIICLGVLGALILFLIVVCSIAKRNQIVLSRTPYTLNNEAASLEFRN